MFYKIIKIAAILTLITLTPFWLNSLVTFSFENNTEDKNYTALVLGSGVYFDGQGGYYPTETLANRLDKSIELLNENKVNKIIVSGDNTYVTYNEPEVMKEYLIEHGVGEDVIIEDFAGRRTADSCWRAKNVFNAKNVYIVTQAFHLPRSRMLCESYGLNTKTAIADDYSWDITKRNLVRETFATWLAIKDISTNYKAEIQADGTETTLN